MSKDYEAYLLVALGGFAGACARHVVSTLVPSMPGILLINVTGCILLGFLMYGSIYAGAFSLRSRALLGAGFLGAFTTFSAFSLQTLEAPALVGLFNVGLNLCLGLAGILAGRQIAVLAVRRI